MSVPLQWRHLGASVAGFSHEERNIPCQDASATASVLVEQGEVLMLVASDGAGSAAHSEVGSRTACAAVIRNATQWLEDGNAPDDLDRGVIDDWLLDAIGSIATEAGLLEVRPRELACTMLLAVIGPERAAFAQIGDGAIVFNGVSGFETAFWPQSGEYANMTYFLTDAEALTQLQYRFEERAVEEVALMTDGIQILALHYASRSVHEPFFRSFFFHLRQQSAGECVSLQLPLVSFLSSAAVNERTDDDKTLILATRRAPEAEPAELLPTALDQEHLEYAGAGKVEADIPVSESGISEVVAELEDGTNGEGHGCANT